MRIQTYEERICGLVEIHGTEGERMKYLDTHYINRSRETWRLRLNECQELGKLLA